VTRICDKHDGATAAQASMGDAAAAAWLSAATAI
jgi:hypothetical protein